MSSPSSDSSIRIIGNSGREGKGENQFAQPRGICINSKTKEIFIVDCNNHRIQVYHLNSLAYIRQIGKGVQGNLVGSLNYAVGLCLDDSNQLFAADTNNHRIAVFNSITGVHTRSIGSHGVSDGCFKSPYGVCVDDSTGYLYVADYDNHRVQVFNKETGEFVRKFGSGLGSGVGQMNQPIVLCLDSDTGYLFVADYSNNRVIVMNKTTGVFIRYIGAESGPDAFKGPRALCISKEAGLLFVSDRENHRIQIYNKHTFTLLRHLGNGIGVEPGQFNRPMEMCCNIEEGVLLVVDGYNHRVQIMEIPELQAEKIKYKAAQKAKLDAEFGGKMTPKASKLATHTKLLDEVAIVENKSDGSCILHFSSFLDLYVVHLSAEDTTKYMELLASSSHRRSPVRPTCNNEQHDIRTEDASLIIHSSCSHSHDQLTSSSILSTRQLDKLNKQADLFLGILEGLAASSGDNYDDDKNDQSERASTESDQEVVSSNFVLVAPAVSALHSLLRRQWVPNRMSEPVISLLLSYLTNMKSGVNVSGEGEKLVLTQALVDLLRESLKIDSDVNETILSLLLKKLEPGIAFRLENRTISVETNAMSSEQQTDELQLQQNAEPEENYCRDACVLYSYFDLLVEIARRGNIGLPPTVTHDCSHICMACVGNDRCRLFYEDLMCLMYGGAFVSPLLRFHRDSVNTDSVKPPQHNANEKVITEGKKLFDSEKRDNLVFTSGINTLLYTMYRINSLRKVHTSELHLERKSAPSVRAASSTAVPFRDVQTEFLQRSLAYLEEAGANQAQENFVANSASSAAALNQSNAPPRQRGGRNIWNPDCSLAMGDLVDAMDKEKVWFESIVQEVSSTGVKVHFMGWGAKWDDIIPLSELPQRISPLNSRTVNWRKDVYEGGLIEIKCNDDLVNQKWMWGKVTSLNVDDSWVEVSYSFANEPAVIKRAWLFGETICPIGMHTKDKSRAAAATVPKPNRTVETILKEKAMKAPKPVARCDASESSFFDKDDDFEMLADGVLNRITAVIPSDESDAAATTCENKNRQQSFHNNVPATLPAAAHPAIKQTLDANYESYSAQNTGGFDLNVLNSNPNIFGLYSVVLNDRNTPTRHIDFIAYLLWDSVFREIVAVVSEAIVAVESKQDPISFQKYVDQARNTNPGLISALAILNKIAHGPFKRILNAYFVLPLLFQCGMKSKVVAASFLARQVQQHTVVGASKSEEEAATIRFHFLRNIAAVKEVLKQLQRVSASFKTVLSVCLSGGLSPKTISHLIKKVQATVDQCGTATVSDGILAHVLSSPVQRFEIFETFTSGDRFNDVNAERRQILSVLLKSVSCTVAKDVKHFVENLFLKLQLSKINCTICERSTLAEDFCIGVNRDTRTNISQRCLDIMTKLHRLFFQFRSLAKTELAHLYQGSVATERALRCLMTSLDGRAIKNLSIVAARALDMLLDVSHAHRFVQENRVNILANMLNLLNCCMTEEFFHYFQPHYENLLSFRLARDRCYSLGAEKSVLEKLPLMPHAFDMLADMEQMPTYTLEFSRYLLDRVDSDNLECCPSVELALQGEDNFATKVVSSASWPCTTACMQFSSLVLPPEMLVLKTEFELFLDSRRSSLSISPETDTTKMFDAEASTHKTMDWCFGLGTVTMACILEDGTSVDLEFNEAQASVLMQFNDYEGAHKAVTDLCRATGLSLEEMRPVLASLWLFDRPVLDIDIDCSKDTSSSIRSHPDQYTMDVYNRIEMDSKVSIANSFLSDSGYKQHQYDTGDSAAMLAASGAPTLITSYASACCDVASVTDMRAVADWRLSKIDAAIVRVLKESARNSSSISNSSTSSSQYMNIHQIIVAVKAKLIQIVEDTAINLSASTVHERCKHLVSTGVIWASSKTASKVQEVDFSYLPEPEQSESESESVSAIRFQTSSPLFAGDALECFDKLLSIVTQFSSISTSKKHSPPLGVSMRTSLSNASTDENMSSETKMNNSCCALKDASSSSSSSQSKRITRQSFCESFVKLALSTVSDKVSSAESEEAGLKLAMCDAFDHVVDNVNLLLHKHRLIQSGVAASASALTNNIYPPPPDIDPFKTNMKQSIMSRDSSSSSHFVRILPLPLVVALGKSYILLLKSIPSSKATMLSKWKEMEAILSTDEELVSTVVLEFLATVMDTKRAVLVLTTSKDVAQLPFSSKFLHHLRACCMPSDVNNGTEVVARKNLTTEDLKSSSESMKLLDSFSFEDFIGSLMSFGETGCSSNKSSRISFGDDKELISQELSAFFDFPSSAAVKQSFSTPDKAEGRSDSALEKFDYLKNLTFAPGQTPSAPNSSSRAGVVVSNSRSTNGGSGSGSGGAGGSGRKGRSRSAIAASASGMGQQSTGMAASAAPVASDPTAVRSILDSVIDGQASFNFSGGESTAPPFVFPPSPPLTSGIVANIDPSDGRSSFAFSNANLLTYRQSSHDPRLNRFTQAPHSTLQPADSSSSSSSSIVDAFTNGAMPQLAVPQPLAINSPTRATLASSIPPTSEVLSFSSAGTIGNASATAPTTSSVFSQAFPDFSLSNSSSGPAFVRGLEEPSLKSMLSAAAAAIASGQPPDGLDQEGAASFNHSAGVDQKISSSNIKPFESEFDGDEDAVPPFDINTLNLPSLNDLGLNISSFPPVTQNNGGDMKTMLRSVNVESPQALFDLIHSILLKFLIRVQFAAAPGSELHDVVAAASAIENMCRTKVVNTTDDKDKGDGSSTICSAASSSFSSTLLSENTVVDFVTDTFDCALMKTLSETQDDQSFVNDQPHTAVEDDKNIITGTGSSENICEEKMAADSSPDDLQQQSTKMNKGNQNRAVKVNFRLWPEVLPWWYSGPLSTPPVSLSWKNLLEESFNLLDTDRDDVLSVSDFLYPDPTGSVASSPVFSKIISGEGLSAILDCCYEYETTPHLMKEVELDSTAAAAASLSPFSSSHDHVNGSQYAAVWLSIKRVSSVTGLSELQAAQLLARCHWDEQQACEQLLLQAEEPEQILQLQLQYLHHEKQNLLNVNNPDIFSPSGPFCVSLAALWRSRSDLPVEVECGHCNKMSPIQRMLALPCLHFYCKSCWKQHITDFIGSQKMSASSWNDDVDDDNVRSFQLGCLQTRTEKDKHRHNCSPSSCTGTVSSEFVTQAVFEDPDIRKRFVSTQLSILMEDGRKSRYGLHLVNNFVSEKPSFSIGFESTGRSVSGALTEVLGEQRDLGVDYIDLFSIVDRREHLLTVCNENVCSGEILPVALAEESHHHGAASRDDIRAINKAPEDGSPQSPSAKIRKTVSDQTPFNLHTPAATISNLKTPSAHINKAQVVVLSAKTRWLHRVIDSVDGIQPAYIPDVSLYHKLVQKVELLKLVLNAQVLLDIYKLLPGAVSESIGKRPALHHQLTSSVESVLMDRLSEEVREVMQLLGVSFTSLTLPTTSTTTSLTPGSTAIGRGQTQGQGSVGDNHNTCVAGVLSALVHSSVDAQRLRTARASVRLSLRNMLKPCVPFASEYVPFLVPELQASSSSSSTTTVGSILSSAYSRATSDGSDSGFSGLAGLFAPPPPPSSSSSSRSPISKASSSPPNDRPSYVPSSRMALVSRGHHQRGVRLSARASTRDLPVPLILQQREYHLSASQCVKVFAALADGIRDCNVTQIHSLMPTLRSFCRVLCVAVLEWVEYSDEAGSDKVLLVVASALRALLSLSSISAELGTLLVENSLLPLTLFTWKLCSDCVAAMSRKHECLHHERVIGMMRRSCKILLNVCCSSEANKLNMQQQMLLPTLDTAIVFVGMLEGLIRTSTTEEVEIELVSEVIEQIFLPLKGCQHINSLEESATVPQERNEALKNGSSLLASTLCVALLSSSTTRSKVWLMKYLNRLLLLPVAQVELTAITEGARWLSVWFKSSALRTAIAGQTAELLCFTSGSGTADSDQQTQNICTVLISMIKSSSSFPFSDSSDSPPSSCSASKGLDTANPLSVPVLSLRMIKEFVVCGGMHALVRCLRITLQRLWRSKNNSITETDYHDHDNLHHQQQQHHHHRSSSSSSSRSSRGRRSIDSSSSSRSSSRGRRSIDSSSSSRSSSRGRRSIDSSSLDTCEIIAGVLLGIQNLSAVIIEVKGAMASAGCKHVASSAVSRLSRGPHRVLSFLPAERVDNLVEILRSLCLHP